MDALKRIEKIIRENAFEQKKKKLRLKFNPELALIGLQTTGPRSLPKNESKTKNIQWSLHSQDTYQTRVGVPGMEVYFLLRDTTDTKIIQWHLHPRDTFRIRTGMP